MLEQQKNSTEELPLKLIYLLTHPLLNLLSQYICLNGDVTKGKK